MKQVSLLILTTLISFGFPSFGHTTSASDQKQKEHAAWINLHHDLIVAPQEIVDTAFDHSAKMKTVLGAVFSTFLCYAFIRTYVYTAPILVQAPFDSIGVGSIVLLLSSYRFKSNYAARLKDENRLHMERILDTWPMIKDSYRYPLALKDHFTKLSASYKSNALSRGLLEKEMKFLKKECLAHISS